MATTEADTGLVVGGHMSKQGHCSTGISLLALFEHAPSLLDACLDDKMAAGRTLMVRSLRLVSKEASRVALLGIRFYTLRLEGGAKDTNVSGARLLHHAHLQSLAVHLHLTGSYSPALLLEIFLCEVGEALHTIRSLAIRLQDTCGSASNTALLRKVLVMLVGACPILSSLTVGGSSHPLTLCTLGQACPLLTAVTVESEDEALLEIQQLVDQLPSLLPNVHSLSFTCLRRVIPNFSKSVGITTLRMMLFTFASEFKPGHEAQWLSLPPHLQHLVCFTAHAGPVSSSTGTGRTCSRAVLCDLLTLEIRVPELQLRALAEILRQAPALQFIKTGVWTYQDPIIDCFVDQTSAADLSVLLSRSAGVDGLQNAIYQFNANQCWVEGPELLPLLKSLPCMTCVRNCDLNWFSAEGLQVLLGMFPDVRTLALHNLDGVDDIGLQAVAACKDLERLKLSGCSEVTPMGLHALCPRLPHLRLVSVCECLFLKEPGLGKCVELLRGQEVIVKMVDEIAVAVMEG